jgi:hypothetical protein
MILAGLLAAGLAVPAGAATIVTATFAGTILSGTDVTNLFQTGLVDLANPGGTDSPPAVTGTFSYDIDAYPPDGSGIYGGTDPFLSFTVTIGGTSYNFGSLPAIYHSGYVQDGPDDLNLFMQGGDDSGSETETIGIDLSGQEFVTGTDLPIHFTLLGNGGTGNFVIQNAGGIADAFFSITCASTEIDCAADTGSAVPEPSTWNCLIAGFGLIGAAIRQRRRRPGLRCASA